VFLYHTHANFFSYKCAIVNSNEIILELNVSIRETIYSHVKSFGTSDYISDSNRNAEVLLKTADNGQHIENSMKFSGADSYVKVSRFANVSGTDFVPIFKVLRWFGSTNRFLNVRGKN
jgi:hypothetical protein